jgi:hypothetical protein
MRARKAERCLQRASAALDSGSATQAADALDEARELEPSNPHLAELAARLEALKNPPPEPRASLWTSAAVILWSIVLGVAGWQLWAHRADWSFFSGTPQSVDAGPAIPNVPAADMGQAPDAAASNGSSLRALVETTVVQPEAVPVVADTEIEADSAPPPVVPTLVATSGSDRRADTPVNAPLTLTGQKSFDRAAAMETSPATLEYPAPAALPPPSVPPASTPFIPSVVAPEPSRSVSAASNSAREPVEPAANSSTAANAVVPTANVVSPARDDRAAVRAALGKYEAAYNRLDVGAVRTVWPTLDQRALSRAFDSLAAQRVSLQNCDVDVSGSSARANCSGRASWTPKIGGGEQSASRKWTFDLSELDGGWRITHVQAR